MSTHAHAATGRDDVPDTIVLIHGLWLTALSWEHWARRVQKYLTHVEMLFSPELFIIGGGISRKAHKFLPLIEGVRAEMIPAELRNNAGIVGAAMAASAAGAAPVLVVEEATEATDETA